MTKPNEVLEAMCRAHYNSCREQGGAAGKNMCPWDELDETSKEYWRASMKAAIRAARELGWKMAPIEMTEHMEYAVYDPEIHDIEAHNFKEEWMNAIKAAPDLVDE